MKRTHTHAHTVRRTRTSGDAHTQLLTHRLHERLLSEVLARPLQRNSGYSSAQQSVCRVNQVPGSSLSLCQEEDTQISLLIPLKCRFRCRLSAKSGTICSQNSDLPVETVNVQLLYISGMHEHEVSAVPVISHGSETPVFKLTIPVPGAFSLDTALGNNFGFTVDFMTNGH